MGLENKIALAFFDMDGTILKKTKDTVWGMLAKELGPDTYKAERETRKKWERGEYKGYVEWMTDTMRIFTENGLKKDKFDSVIGSDIFSYQPNVKETFEELRRYNITTALVTAGFKAQADKVQMELKITHSFAACEIFWNTDGSICHYNLLPSYNTGKIAFMHLIMNEHGLTKEQCAFVGDSKGDVPCTAEVGMSIAFNAHPKLQEAAKYSINQRNEKKDFRAILSHIFQSSFA